MAETATDRIRWGKRLVAKITCPNCWHQFPPEDVLFVGKHTDLPDDPVLHRKGRGPGPQGVAHHGYRVSSVPHSDSRGPLGGQSPFHLHHRFPGQR